MSALPSRRRRMQVCTTNNLSRCPVLLAELEREGWVLEYEECLDRCDRCERGAFALVHGRFLFAPSPEEFVRKVK